MEESNQRTTYVILLICSLENYNFNELKSSTCPYSRVALVDVDVVDDEVPPALQTKQTEIFLKTICTFETYNFNELKNSTFPYTAKILIEIQHEFCWLQGNLCSDHQYRGQK